MRIYFEDYQYPAGLLESYFKKMLEKCDDGKVKTRFVGYIYDRSKYDGPIFILPKALLIKKDGKYLFLGIPEAEPEKIIDLESIDNPLNGSDIVKEISGFSMWVYRVIALFHERKKRDTSIIKEAELVKSKSNIDSSSKDFLSSALQLVDFFKEHESIFTTITKENHSGNNNTSWQRTISRSQPYVTKEGDPIYVQTINKKKEIDTDEKLIILFYSVLNYLKREYYLPIHLGDIIYPIIPKLKVGTMISNGMVPKELKGTRNLYYREDLRKLWRLLEAFFKYNRSTDRDKKDLLVVGNFNIVFEDMIDYLISDPDVPKSLKYQDDNKIVDHIYIDRSLVGNNTHIYYIADSKYYKDGNDVTGPAVYKQFTYAKNAIQHNIERLFLEKHLDEKTLESLHYRDSVPLGLNVSHDLQKYHDSLTEGYNVTPNFFIRNGVPNGEIDYSDPYITPAEKDRRNDTIMQFVDRLFDRDTLMLREYYINLFFVMRAYARKENWSSQLHDFIRTDLIAHLSGRYSFYKVRPKDLPSPFMIQHFHELIGKAYRPGFFDDDIILAFENTDLGRRNKAAIEKSIAQDIEGPMTPYHIEQ